MIDFYVGALGRIPQPILKLKVPDAYLSPAAREAARAQQSWAIVKWTVALLLLVILMGLRQRYLKPKV